MTFCCVCQKCYWLPHHHQKTQKFVTSNLCENNQAFIHRGRTANDWQPVNMDVKMLDLESVFWRRKCSQHICNVCDEKKTNISLWFDRFWMKGRVWLSAEQQQFYFTVIAPSRGQNKAGLEKGCGRHRFLLWLLHCDWLQPALLISPFKPINAASVKSDCSV